MLKKTVTYINADGATVSKDVHFNISANELLKKEAESGQTFSERIKQIAESKKLQEIYPLVLEMMGYGYGIRTDDGDFMKDPTGAAWGQFQNTLAFETLMDDLLIKDAENNGNRLADFINAMLPQDLMARAAEQQATPGFRPGADTSRPTPPSAQAPVDLGGVPATVINPPSAAPADAPAAPVEVAPSDPAPEQSAPAAEPGFIQQTSEPRTPEVPGQAPQQ